jgi:hypothetical protein
MACNVHSLIHHHQHGGQSELLQAQRHHQVLDPGRQEVPSHPQPLTVQAVSSSLMHGRAGWARLPSRVGTCVAPSEAHPVALLVRRPLHTSTPLSSLTRPHTSSHALTRPRTHMHACSHARMLTRTGADFQIKNVEVDDDKVTLQVWDLRNDLLTTETSSC